MNNIVSVTCGYMRLQYDLCFVKCLIFWVIILRAKGFVENVEIHAFFFT